jgi:hypothetical protein
LRRNGPPFDFFDIAAIADPFRPQPRQSTRNVDIHIQVTPRAARVVNAHRFVDLDLTVHRLRRRKRDLAERDPNIGMQFAV